LLGYVALVGLAICAASGAVVTVEGVWKTRTSVLWRQIHFVTTFVTLVGVAPHVIFSVIKALRNGSTRLVRPYLVQTGAAFALAVLAGRLSFPT
jgi:hypothetical protein